jgi:hypothetical protein
MKDTTMKIFTLIAIASIIILSCSNETDPDYDSDINSLSGKNIYESINIANQWRVSKTKITSFITPRELVFQFPDGREVKKSLPSDSMYIAIAPYQTYTHTCSTHYLSTCKAEKINTLFAVSVKDDKGNYIFDKQITTLDNGFFEIWLSRNKTFNLHIAEGSLNADEIITTSDVSKTCITTALLK